MSDVSSRESVYALAENAAAGVPPSQATTEVILAVDLYGTALVLEEFGNVIASGGAGVVIASQSGHRLGALTAEEDNALATTPADALLALPMLQPDQITDTFHADQASRVDALVRSALDEEGTTMPEAEPEGLNQADSEDGRYWARTSDPQLVELVLSQLS
jgi:hypothetical protein